ncbi:hypothetical protein [Streptomyces sp. NPDC051211]|uniref:hypothetical protein n=1 Tax=Streptomyces sp. NPDC051211 TaxID=3154643 RepID=UPI00344F4225
MHHTPLPDDTELLPWGEVTPAFWQQPTEPTGHLSAEPAPAEQQAPYAPPAGEAAVAPPPAKPGASPELPAAAEPSEAAEPGPLPGSQAASDDAVPDEYRTRIAAITAAIASPHEGSRLAEAEAEAGRLDDELAERFGAGHVHTINLRELRGWLALVSGRPAAAARWYLHTTQLHSAAHGPTHPATESSGMRALHSWTQIEDDREVLELAPELEAMLTQVTGQDSDPVRFVRTRAERRQAAAQP